ncbi:unnamed protein product [Calypogeia fissa]
MGAANMTSKDLEVHQMFGSLSWIASVLLLLVVSIVVQRLLFGVITRKNLPPMPKGLPILGTMLKTRGPKTHRILINMAKEFGPLFALKTGLKHFIVITSADIAHEALIKNSQVFSTRPRLLSRLNFTGWRSVNSALYGPYWRGIRKNLVTQVLSTTRVAAFQPFREMELHSLIERLRIQAKENDNVVPVLSNCRHTVFAILLHVCFGQKFDMSLIRELDSILRRLLVILAPQVIDFLPFIQLFSKKHRNECQELLGRMRRIFAPLIDEHRELRERGNPASGDYVDSLIMLQKEMNLKETDVLGLIGEALVGGTDTTANALEWTMANLIQYPEIQARLAMEIESIVPDGRNVEEEDVEKMEYLQAVVKEALRRHPPLPFGILHGVTEPTKLRGYDIPEDAFILFHIQAMQNDPQRWDEPEKFKPERFLSPTPNPDYDMTGSHGPRSLDFIPFGAGRRMCPAMNLALKHVHLILASLVQTFEWSTVKPGQDVDFSEELAFTIFMSNPLYARIRERSPMMQ